MNPQCTVIAVLHARPEKRTELLTLLNSFVSRSRSEPGIIDYHFHISDDDPNVILFYENYASRVDFEQHLQLPYQKEWASKHHEFLSKPIAHKFYSMRSLYNKISQ